MDSLTAEERRKLAIKAGKASAKARQAEKDGGGAHGR